MHTSYCSVPYNKKVFRSRIRDAIWKNIFSTASFQKWFSFLLCICPYYGFVVIKLKIAKRRDELYRYNKTSPIMVNFRVASSSTEKFNSHWQIFWVSCTFFSCNFIRLCLLCIFFFGVFLCVSFALVLVLFCVYNYRCHLLHYHQKQEKILAISLFDFLLHALQPRFSLSFVFVYFQSLNVFISSLACHWHRPQERFLCCVSFWLS